MSASVTVTPVEDESFIASVFIRYVDMVLLQQQVEKLKEYVPSTDDETMAALDMLDEVILEWLDQGGAQNYD